MRIATLVVLTAALVSALAVPAAGAEKPAPPNIILILADDYGLDGVSCYGSDRFKGKTPHLDKLANEGIRFERCYSTPLCAARCLINTGRYAFRTGGLTNPSAHRPASADEPALARTLKQAGYATGMAGKWRQMGETPGDWGFDEYITDPTAGGYYWVKSYTQNGKLVEKDQEFYYPDVCHQFALDFLKRHRDRPFYFYYASHLVHGPILRTPDSKAGAAPKGDPGLYDDNVAYLDKQVGELVAEVDRLNLRRRTLILFTADNGTARQSGTLHGRPINGAKGSMWEGGTRVPLIASWKGTAPEGRVVKDLVDFSDLFATFADLGGARLPQGVTFDGHSFAPQLRGQSCDPREWIFVQLGRRWYVRDDGWKFNHLGELFDMRDAPFVEKPMAADAQDAPAAAARKRLQAALDQLNPAAGKTVPEDEKPRPKAKRAKRAKAKPLEG